MGFSLLKKLVAQISLFSRIKIKADFIDKKKEFEEQELNI
jgi:hypothetical protein